jgi:Peptidase family M48
VIGHEMAHIRNCDVQLTTMVTAMFGGFGAYSGRLISIMLSREREYLADASAVEFTRNPTALVRALEHIAKTESPLGCATPGTAQLFIVDPFERADSGRTYQQFINEVTRIRSQPDQTEAQRNEEARNFAAHEYPRNMVLEAVSSHPPLRERIARLQALIGAASGTVPASGLTDDQLKAKFSDSAQFVRDLATTDPEVMATVMQSALVALPAGRSLLKANASEPQIQQIQQGASSRDPIEQQLYESFLASTGDLKRARSHEQKLYGSKPASVADSTPDGGSDLSPASVLGGDLASATGTSLPNPAATEELEREALAKMLAPVAAAMRPNKATTHLTVPGGPAGSSGAFLFWIAIAVSAGAIVAALAAR